MGSAAGCLGDDSPVPDEPPPETAITAAPIPADPRGHRYETMGTGDDPVVTYYSSWKCPACASFSEGLLETIASEFVGPGSLSLVHRALGYAPNGDPFLGADAPLISRAGIAVWRTDPDHFWPFYKLVMRNQPPPEEEWATADTVMNFASTAGVADIDGVEELLHSEAIEEAVMETTAAASSVGVGGTPWFEVGGDSFSPTDDPDATIERLEAAVDEASTG